MKRSQALVALSRDHHKALAVAQKLRRVEDAPEAAALFQAYWEDTGPVTSGWRGGVAADLGSARRDQPRGSRETGARASAIRTAALKLVEQPELDLARDLGQLLADHVRFEERELFGLIEKDLDRRSSSCLPVP